MMVLSFGGSDPGRSRKRHEMSPVRRAPPAGLASGADSPELGLWKPLGALTRSEQAIFPKQLWCGMRVIRYLQGGGLAITSFSLLTWRKHLSPHHQLKLLDPSRPSQVNG